MSQFYTYLHCKPDGTPFYVGKGTGDRAYRLLSRRINLHHRNIINKYGEEKIKIFVFECDSERQAFDDEIQHIAQLRKEGYRLANKSNGGEGPSGFKHSEETRKKISLIQIGKTLTDEHRKRISIGNTGKKMSLEARQHISDGRKGMSFSVEHKSNLSKARRQSTLCAIVPSIGGRANKGKKQPLIACPHCGKIGGNKTMPRWHFSNCKER